MVPESASQEHASQPAHPSEPYLQQRVPTPAPLAALALFPGLAGPLSSTPLAGGRRRIS